MIEKIQTVDNDTPSEVPREALSSPALLYLYYRIERALGIKAGSSALVNLNEHIEKSCGASFIENPAVFERFLSSRERIYDISRFITVNETYFFREEAHFEILSGLLSEFAKLNRPLKICSAAVSIGCEAYSIAMFFDYYIKKGLDIEFTIDAFDIDACVIETAKNARYTANAFRVDGSSWKNILDLYLIPDNGEYIVSSNIREKVNFFTHNIMRGLDKQYDIIFFRNSLIYFSSKSRLSVINNISDALLNNGYLFLGTSETSSINHPLLLNRVSCGSFYFQKKFFMKIQDQLENKPKESAQEISNKIREEIKHKPLPVKREEMPIRCAGVSEILKTDEGKVNAQNVTACLSDGTCASLSGNGLAACALYCLHVQDYETAGRAISYLEKYNGSEFTQFLRGELLFLQGSYEEAQNYYQEAAVKNRFFWPAFYRTAILAAEGNRTRYEYKIKKAIESIKLAGQEHDNERNYECFLGGFSSDYFIRILKRKIDTERGVT
jgi:chemotaxis protein methyltransferase CheR